MYSLKKPYTELYRQHFVLETIVGDITGVGLHTEPIQQMRSKQKHRRKTMYNHMACQRPENIAHKQKHSRRHTEQTQQQIQKKKVHLQHVKEKY